MHDRESSFHWSIHYHVPGVNFANDQARAWVFTQVVNARAKYISSPGTILLIMRNTIVRRHLLVMRFTIMEHFITAETLIREQ